MRLWQNRIINNESGNIAAFIVNYSRSIKLLLEMSLR